MQSVYDPLALSSHAFARALLYSGFVHAENHDLPALVLDQYLRGPAMVEALLDGPFLSVRQLYPQDQAPPDSLLSISIHLISRKVKY